MLGFYRKITILDEEADWFSPGTSVAVFRNNALAFSIAICADLRNEDVFAQSSNQGAQMIFEVSPSESATALPGTRGLVTMSTM